MRYKHTDPTTQAFAKWLRQERRDVGWSIARVAQESGVSKTALWNIEHLNASPMLETMHDICHAFGVDPIEALSQGAALLD